MKSTSTRPKAAPLVLLLLGLKLLRRLSLRLRLRLLLLSLGLSEVPEQPVHGFRLSFLEDPVVALELRTEMQVLVVAFVAVDEGPALVSC